MVLNSHNSNHHQKTTTKFYLKTLFHNLETGCMGTASWNPWGPMGSHGFSWVPMGSHGFPWVPMGSHGSPWVPMGPHGDPMVGLSRPGSLGRAPDTGWRVPREGFQKKKRREQTKRSIRIERHDTIDPTRAAFSSDRLRFGTNGLGATACPKASCMKLLAWVAQHALRFHFDLFTSISRSNSLRSHFETNPSPTPPKRTDPSPKRTNPFSNPSPKRTNPPPTPPKRTNPSPKRKPNCETQSIRRVIRNDSDDGNENEHEKKRN